MSDNPPAPAESHPIDTIPVAIYDGDMASVTVRVVGGQMPLTLGARVEVEVTEIVRFLIERAP